MQFKNIQINGFGNLENKSINLKNGINLIIGDNESGKSTLTEFIKGIFYGVNKNKNGKDFSDLEKFKPWNEKNFSGKLVYNISDDEYTVYRDFNKNNAKIYDKDGKDITDTFNKDKSRGAEVGFAHLEMDEETFENSVFIKQKEIKVNELAQNVMIQKLSNIIKTGEEEISYENTIKKLEKILFDEVGTDRTQNKPKNILKKDILNLELAKENLIINKEKYENINAKLKNVRNNLEQTEKNLDSMIKVFNIKNKYEKVIQEEKNKFDAEQKVKAEQNEKQKKQVKKRKIIDTILIAILTIILAVTLVFVNQLLFAILTAIIGSASMILNLKFSYKEELDIKSNNFDTVIEEIRKKEEKELLNLEKEDIKRIYLENKISELKVLIEENEKEKNNLILEEHKLKIEEEALSDKIDNLNEIEEELTAKKEDMNSILKKEDILNYAIKNVKLAYEELKEEVIPTIEKDIRNEIAKTTNGKYANIKYNDYEGLIAENGLGELIPIEKLSIGTLDQMYLGFRMAIADKYKNVPLVFDETFVYCDDSRLKNILKILGEISKTRQIIILTCSNREKDLLEKENIEFNEIEI